MDRLRSIGLQAEEAMLVATRGVNTHRGAIFGLGLLCAAAGARLGGLSDPAIPLGAIVARRWGRDILGGVGRRDSHGQAVRRLHGAGGASLEAAHGFPVLYAVGVPALRAGAWLAPDDAEAARVQSCFALIAMLEDTNLLHRGGLTGLHFAQRAARRFLADGGVGRSDWRVRAMDVHRGFVARRLSPGGSADLLAMSLFVQAFETRGP
jgi:triphosphoribosyl-dephospho-CoA synthase